VYALAGQLWAASIGQERWSAGYSNSLSLDSSQGRLALDVNTEFVACNLPTW